MQADLPPNPFALERARPCAARVFAHKEAPFADAGKLHGRFKSEEAFFQPERPTEPVLRDAGHFLEWDVAELLNNAVRAFCRDLLRT